MIELVLTMGAIALIAQRIRHNLRIRKMLEQYKGQYNCGRMV